MASEGVQKQLIRGYIAANARFAKKKPIDGQDWVKNTVLFGKRMVVVGAALLVLCAFLPNDARRLAFIGAGLLVLVVGFWHQRSAQAIFDAANAQRPR